jgi:RecA-superfamily ATPases implicated in signal transduction
MYTYKTGIALIDDVTGGLGPGMNILILAPPLSGADTLGACIARPGTGEYSIIISTEERSIDMANRFSAENLNRNHIGIIDAITKMSSPEASDSVHVKFVASPSDLTGIGIKFSQIVESIFNGEFEVSADVDLFPPPIRFYINSLSTLLMYRKLEVLYQFLHVLGAKLKKMEGFGVYILNNESFDEKTVAVMKQLMNVVIEVKVESDGHYLRIRGLSGVSGDWYKFRIENGEVVIGK